jgi:predicted nucleic acid-binding protein
MRAYLLDTNVWSDWYNPAKSKTIIKKVAQLKNPEKLQISIITWGELRFGFNVLSREKREELGDVEGFVKEKNPYTITIDDNVTKQYGILRARLFKKYAPNTQKRKGLRPEQLIDPVTSLALGIQENDLWIAAQAINWGLILVTRDKMDRIREIACPDLIIENWSDE